MKRSNFHSSEKKHKAVNITMINSISITVCCHFFYLQISWQRGFKESEKQKSKEYCLTKASFWLIPIVNCIGSHNSNNQVKILGH
jgi:hypothetical protein